ncbi:MAG: sugar phosphate isomerase/epimerase family protein [Planctomycetota bacterium]
MIPALSQVCSLASPFEKDVEDYAAGQCRALEVWLTKLEQFLQTHSVTEVRQLFEQHEMTIPAASYQGGLLSSQGEKRQESWELFRRRLDLCAELKIPVLVVACDVPPPLDQATLERVTVSLEQAAQEAGRRRLRLALEFQAHAAFGNNLQTTAALVQDVGSPHLGICLDVFHHLIGPSKTEDLHYLTAENLFHVQVSDLADVPRELASDADRILPGDGDFPWPPLLERLRQIDYCGAVSVEILNPKLWAIPALQFGEVALTALRKLLAPSPLP